MKIAKQKYGSCAFPAIPTRRFLEGGGPETGQRTGDLDPLPVGPILNISRGGPPAPASPPPPPTPINHINGINVITRM